MAICPKEPSLPNNLFSPSGKATQVLPPVTRVTDRDPSIHEVISGDLVVFSGKTAGVPSQASSSSVSSSSGSSSSLTSSSSAVVKKDCNPTTTSTENKILIAVECNVPTIKNGTALNSRVPAFRKVFDSNVKNNIRVVNIRAIYTAQDWDWTACDIAASSNTADGCDCEDAYSPLYYGNKADRKDASKCPEIKASSSSIYYSTLVSSSLVMQSSSVYIPPGDNCTIIKKVPLIGTSSTIWISASSSIVVTQSSSSISSSSSSYTSSSSASCSSGCCDPCTPTCDCINFKVMYDVVIPETGEVFSLASPYNQIRPPNSVDIDVDFNVQATALFEFDPIRGRDVPVKLLSTAETWKANSEFTEVKVLADVYYFVDMNGNEKIKKLYYSLEKGEVVEVTCDTIASPRPYQLFVVNVEVDGGSNGDRTTAPTWTYTVYSPHPVDDGLGGQVMVEIGSAMTPDAKRTTAKYMEPGALEIGSAYYNDQRVLYLKEANEVLNVGGC